ncbi:MAG: roadblock/LC7 domain-containing protein [candidate division WOR-3 bacterium]|jgi:predicted regulator of Ras-like GTPase activity (Roadblock/LC7/MglB family)
MIEIETLRKEAEKFIPDLLGIIIVDEYGLPISYSLSTILEDPIVVSGLLSSAVNMIENLLKELSNANFELLYTQGDKICIFIGKIKSLYLGFITSPTTKVGTIFMEYKILRPKLENYLSEITGG